MTNVLLFFVLLLLLILPVAGANRSCVELDLICIDDRLTVPMKSVEMIFFEYKNETNGWLSIRTSSDQTNPRYVHLQVTNEIAKQVQSNYRDYRERDSFACHLDSLGNQSPEDFKQFLDVLLNFESTSLTDEQILAIETRIKEQHKAHEQFESDSSEFDRRTQSPPSLLCDCSNLVISERPTLTSEQLLSLGEEIKEQYKIVKQQEQTKIPWNPDRITQPTTPSESVADDADNAVHISNVY